MKNSLLDTHCHINEYNRPQDILHICEREKIFTMATTNHPSEYAGLRQLINRSPYVVPAIGFHPMLAEGYEQVYSFEEQFRAADYVGEIGLDFSVHYRETKDSQLALFKTILGFIKGRKRVITIHSRRAEREVLELLAKHGIESPILHWYSGGMQVLQAAIEYGCYFSVNTSMIGSEKGQKIIKRLPRERVLTETDGPYIERDGVPDTPLAVGEVCEYLGQLWQVERAEVVGQIGENFGRIAGV